jgi:putative ABC transport system permease protein
MNETFRLALGALIGHRQRTFLSILGISIGIAAVVLLTSVGEGTRRYILGEFSQFGTHIIGINPGKSETFGIPGVMGGTTQKLTIDDSEALERIPGVELVVPLVVGQGRVEARGRGRSVFVYGVTSDMPELWQFDLGYGSFLPPGDPRRTSSMVVLGPKLKSELFGDENPLGEFVRIAGRRLRVIGVMAPKGQILGTDIDDVAYVPVATALTLFNMAELTEIDLSYAEGASTPRVVDDITALLTERHSGREDFTITTQEAMLSVFGNVMDVITVAVGGIGAISLLVGAIGILTMMWISVGERTHEIGLLKALGATRRQILGLFIAEAVVLGLAGGVLGAGGGLGLVGLIRLLVPALPLGTPIEYVVAALCVSLFTGLASGILPARRAAAMDPILALRTE